jgi:hypothetical protein
MASTPAQETSAEDSLRRAWDGGIASPPQASMIDSAMVDTAQHAALHRIANPPTPPPDAVTTGMQMVARGVGVYYRGLLEQGIPAEMASTLAKDAHDRLMAMMEQGAEQQRDNMKLVGKIAKG